MFGQDKGEYHDKNTKFFVYLEISECLLPIIFKGFLISIIALLAVKLIQLIIIGIKNLVACWINRKKGFVSGHD